MKVGCRLSVDIFDAVKKENSESAILSFLFKNDPADAAVSIVTDCLEQVMGSVDDRLNREALPMKRFLSEKPLDLLQSWDVREGIALIPRSERLRSRCSSPGFKRIRQQMISPASRE